MHFPVLSLFLFILATIGTAVLPVNLNEDSQRVAIRDENAVTTISNGVANFSLLYETHTLMCGTVSTTIVFNRLTDTKFSPACQQFYDYMTSIPNSSLKYESRGVSLVYICPPTKSGSSAPPDLGEANIKLIINGPYKFGKPPGPVDAMLTVTNTVDDPVTNFTLPASFEFQYAKQLNGWKEISLTYIHCN